MDLLIELFSEEIPARMQARAREDLKRLITDGLVEGGLTYASAGAFSTPRRLALAVEGLTAESKPVREERKGPRTDAPEKAIEGFLRSTGLTLDQLERRAEKKGEVFFAVIEKPGRKAADIVAEVLDATIRDFPWPKSMRWGSGNLRWVRPLHSIIAILSDEIYDVMTYDGEAHTSLLEFDGLRDRLIVLNGWSKTWAMTGWRLGWSVWPEPLYNAVRKLAVNCWSCVNAAAQHAGIAAIYGPQDDVAAMMAAFDARRRFVVERLNAMAGVTCATPKGAFYAFPDISATGWQAKKLASGLLEEAGVALIGGPDFGILGEGFVRVSYANSLANIEAALDRMEAFLSR